GAGPIGLDFGVHRAGPLLRGRRRRIAGRRRARRRIGRWRGIELLLAPGGAEVDRPAAPLRVMRRPFRIDLHPANRILHDRPLAAVILALSRIVPFSHHFPLCSPTPAELRPGATFPAHRPPPGSRATAGAPAQWWASCPVSACDVAPIIGHPDIDCDMPSIIPDRMWPIMCCIISACIDSIDSRIARRCATSSVTPAAVASTFLLPRESFID